jgi:hypothetical protein
MKPGLQVSAQLTPSQLVTPFGSVAQGVHELPQLATEVFAAH